MVRHNPRVAALVMAALFLVPLAAAANEPNAATWSPARAAEPITALALAREGTTMAVGNAGTRDRPVTETLLDQTGAPASSDLGVLDVVTGRLFNSSETPDGRRAVAVSADGKVVVAGGRSIGREVLAYYKVEGPVASSNPNDAVGRQSPQWSDTLAGPAAAVAASRAGARVGAVVNTATGSELVVYTSDRAEIMSFTGAKRLLSLAVSADGNHWVAGGLRSVDGEDRGVVYLFQYPTSDPVHTFTFNSRNATAVRSVAITPDGKDFGALTVGGAVVAFKNAGAATPAPLASGVSLTNVTGRALAMTDDARYFAAAVSEELRLFKPGERNLTRVWAHKAAGSVTSVAANGTGAVIVAGVGGASGGVLAFSPKAAEPYWRLPGGAATNVTVTKDGSWIAFAQGTLVRAHRLHSQFALLHETSPGIGQPTPPPASTQPFKPLAFRLLLKNTGAVPEALRLDVPSITDVTITPSATRFDVVPGESRSITLTVTPGRLAARAYEFNVSAISDRSGTQANLTVAFTVTPTSDLAVMLSGARDRRISAEQNDTIALTLVNNGNSALTVGVDVAQAPTAGPQWQVRLIGDGTFSVAAGSFGTVRVLVATPFDAVNGSTNKVTVTVRSERGTTPIDVVYEVNPFVAVNVTGPGGIRIFPKFVYAGQTVQFNLTVKNTGSVESRFQVAHAPPRVTGGVNWVVDLDISPFPLAAGANRTVPVRVFSPADAEIGDRLSVPVEVSSVPVRVGDRIVVENITLIANVAQPPPPPPSPGRGIPAVSAFAALAAVAAAAFVRGWRP